MLTEHEVDYQGPTCIWLFDSRARALTGRRVVHIVPDAKAAWEIILDGEKVSADDRAGYEMYFREPTNGAADLEADAQTINDFWNIYGWCAESSDDESTMGFANDIIVVNHIVDARAEDSKKEPES